MPKSVARHAAPSPRRWPWLLAVLLVLLALAAFAAAWYFTGGDLTALPALVRELWAGDGSVLPAHSGAALL